MRLQRHRDTLSIPTCRVCLSGRKVVGIITPLADQWFYGKLISNAEIILLTAGYEAVRYDIFSLDLQSEVLHQLLTRKLVDGLIIATLTLAEEQIHLLHRSGIPVVTVETETEYFPSILIDNQAASELATRHLINLGHRQIGLITGLNEDPLRFGVPRQRGEGYRRALEVNGIQLRDEYIVTGNFSYQGGAEAMKQLLSIQRPPTAVFALSDEMAIGALKTVRDMNLRIPEDISIIGFDDNDVAEFVGLTTIRQPVGDFGELAAEQMICQLVEDECTILEKVYCSAELVLRDTTGPAPRP